MPTVEDVTLIASGEPALRLEGRLHLPDRAPEGACLLLHPHMVFGGSMDTWLITRTATLLAARGWTTLRFNFRGVGASQGCSGEGDGEVLDALGGLALLADVVDGAARTAVIGWGFGALVGMLLAEHPVAVTDWIGIGPPTRRLNAIPMLDPPYEALGNWTARRCVIVGEADVLYPPGSVTVLKPDVVHVVPGADHFMIDRSDEVAEVVARALCRPLWDR